MSRPLQFGFDGHSDNLHLPNNYISNTVVYTGTHDNPPTREWYEELHASQELVVQLRAAGHEVIDFGAHSLGPDDDYPDYVTPLARAVAAGQVERGVAICGSGAGASVCANKIPGVRAALIHDHFSARQGV